MHKLEFTQNLSLDPNQQLSPQLADQCTPLHLDSNDNLEQRIKLITFYLLWYNLILKQGDLEHSGDWDPAIQITLNDGQVLGNEAGYSIAEIEGETLVAEFPPEDEGYLATSYLTVLIMDIATIQYIFH